MITIAVFTSRKDPKLDWFADALCNQTTADERAALQVILIDRHLWFPGLFLGARPNTEWVNLCDPQYHNPARARYARECVDGRFNLLHIPPKPCVYQGPWRLASKDWFCAANARNTALLYATQPYFVGADDIAVPMPGWFDQVKHAAVNQYVVCGAYKKVKDMVVENGVVLSHTPFLPGVDSRWNHGSDSGIVKWTGRSFFGCSFGVPLALALKVDGFGPEYNSTGFEDFDFGIRVERAGGEIFYNRNCLTLESEDLSHLDARLPSESRLVTNAEFLPLGYDGNRMSDHVQVNRILSETSRIKPFLKESVYFDSLSQQRDRIAKDGMVNIPREPLTSWIDRKPLSEL